MILKCGWCGESNFVVSNPAGGTVPEVVVAEGGNNGISVTMNLRSGAVNHRVDLAYGADGDVRVSLVHYE